MDLFKQLESEQTLAGNVQRNDVAAFDSSAAAIQSAQEKKNRQMTCIAGSFYLAAEAYSVLEAK